MSAAVDLYWIPLGAGGHYVRLNGRVYEAVVAACAHRPRCDLYHAALVHLARVELVAAPCGTRTPSPHG
jgi:hypothetical protein